MDTLPGDGNDTKHLGSETWSRGCGSGIGLSDHKTKYRMGVTLGNWVEDTTSRTTASRVLPVGGKLSESTAYRQFEGRDSPIPVATVTRNKVVSKKEFWRIRDSVNGLRWATTTDTSIGSFYKPQM
mmetsp:Transcript_8691/g.15688  ORF Transcript_8691/g.15688 Transcript_8691/m.15688 type:complete len:126 (-) Transcript_8691:251-628(-)